MARDFPHTQWPFFEPHHGEFAQKLDAWAAENAKALIDHHDVDGSCRRLVKALGEAGWLKAAVLGATGKPDVRALCLARETLARHEGLADFAFVMQGLGTGSIALFGSDELKAKYLPDVAAGWRIAAFALSEPEAGSDVAAMTTVAVEDNQFATLNGRKTWISNGGIADQYVVFARNGDRGGLSAYVVDADTPGFSIARRIDTVAPHPLAELRFENAKVPLSQRIGNAGEGMKIALTTLDVFRPSVGAAALGMARRAFDEAMAHAASRKIFGATLGSFQLTQAALAEMATEIEASALLVYRAAWAKDTGAARITLEAAMAKMFATEAAQKVIDRAVQMFGGRGVESGNKVEELYREIRALRIYEGATEVQKLIIARELTKPGKN